MSIHGRNLTSASFLFCWIFFHMKDQNYKYIWNNNNMNFPQTQEMFAEALVMGRQEQVFLPLFTTPVFLFCLCRFLSAFSANSLRSDMLRKPNLCSTDWRKFRLVWTAGRKTCSCLGIHLFHWDSGCLRTRCWREVFPVPGFHLPYCFFRFCHVVTLFLFCIYLQYLIFQTKMGYSLVFNRLFQSTSTSYPSILRL